MSDELGSGGRPGETSGLGSESPAQDAQGKVVLSQENKLLVIGAHLRGVFLPLLAPLIIWLVKKDEDELVADQALEALNFQITLLIAFLICAALTCIGIGLVLMPIVGVIGLVLMIMAAVKASNGARYPYPFALRLVK